MNTTRNKIYCQINPQLHDISKSKRDVYYESNLINISSSLLSSSSNNSGIVKDNAKMFNGIIIKKLDGEEIYLSDLWKYNSVILKVLPHLDCKLAHHEAQMLSEFQASFEKNNIKMIVVVLKDLDLTTFLSSGYWKWDLYLDPTSKVFKASESILNSTKLPKFNQFFKYSNIKSLLSHSHTKQDTYSGETYLINSNSEILYSFKPSKQSPFPDIKYILNLLNADMDEIDELIYNVKYNISSPSSSNYSL
ncbi:hypothetical protein K502DRAFT_363016 [Neoconidiobolus thromboides FSU 785]|nr:hypothetical protein K502DRAFT_363016 [Neoconidiobolus thromboides FSU 785]